jgi:hypothetical protein
VDINDFAQMLNGRQYDEEISLKEEDQANELGFVVVFGYSDDCAEFRGAIEDESGTYEGREILLDKNGLFEECEGECKYSELAKKNCKVIEAIWCGDSGWCWQYKTDIPHTTFEIYEDDEKFCQGIVFDIKDL